MNRYRITAIRNKAVLVRTLAKGKDMEETLALFKQSLPVAFGAVSVSIESEQVEGDFDRSREPMANSLALEDGRTLTVRVCFNGWYIEIDGVACPLCDVDASYWSAIKAHARNLAYDAGYYTFKVPGPSTSRWSRADWMNYVTYNFPI